MPQAEFLPLTHQRELHKNVAEKAQHKNKPDEFPLKTYVTIP